MDSRGLSSPQQEQEPSWDVLDVLDVLPATGWSSSGPAAVNQLLETALALMGIDLCCAGSSFP